MTDVLSLQALKEHVVRNSFSNSVGWIANLFINLAAIPLLLRYLGIEGYGVYVLLSGLFGYFGLLDLGFSDAVIRYVASHQELGGENEIASTINTSLVVQSITGCLGVLFICSFGNAILRILHVGSGLFHVALLSLYVSSAGFLVKMLLATFTSALKGIQRFDLTAKTSVGFSLLTTVSAVGVLLLGGGLLAVMSATLFLAVLNLVVVVSLIFRYVSGYHISLRLEPQPFRKLLGFGAYMFVSKLASTLNAYFLQVIVAVFLGPAAVTYFSIPLKCTIAMETGFNSLASVLFPFFSRLRAGGNEGYLRKLYTTASQYLVGLSTPVYLFVMIFSRQIITVWLGKPFADKAWVTLSLLCIASLLAVWTMVPANTIFGGGDPRVTALFSSIVAGVTLLFSVFLTRRMGITGTAAAVLLSALQGPVFIWYVTRRVVSISGKEFFTHVYRKHVILGIAFTFLALCTLGLAGPSATQNVGLILTVGTILMVFYYGTLLRLPVVSASEFGSIP